MASQRVNPGPSDPHDSASDAAAGGKKKVVIGKFAPTPTKKKSGSVYQWEAALADYMKIPYTTKVKAFFDAWNTADNSAATNNPFNITQDYTGGGNSKLAGNSAGVLNFDTPIDGIKATAAFILRNTPQVAAALRASDFRGAANAIGQSGWDGGPGASQSVKTGYANSIYNAFTSGSFKIGSNAPTTLSPKSKAQVETEAATLRAQSEAGSAAYIQAQANLAATKEAAKETLHINDPWVTVLTGKNGVVKFGTATGYNAPKNALSYAGEPLTKSALSSIWTSRYANVYESYIAGSKTPTPGVIVQVLSQGMSPYGLQAALAGGKMQSWKAFTKSSFYKQQIGQYQNSAQTILGSPAPKALLQQAFAESWDTAAFEQNIRTYKAPDGSRPYLKGTEFTNNLASMQKTFQGIYGAPDDDAKQSIKEAAGNGWSPDAFGTYLRQQPQYKTSIEYQSNVMSMMDNLGLLFRMAPVMKPTTAKQQPSGGTPVPNSPLVPGQAGTLNPELGEAAQFMKVGPGN